MAPMSQLGKRVKGVQIHRPFVFGTTAIPFHPKTNPKPPGAPEEHTHSWQVFVKGVDNTDITYWLHRVQFKFHETVTNPIRMVEAGEPGTAFSVQETGWGEFEIAMKLYYVPESGEKPQTLYHHLRLHPYGRNDEEKAASMTPEGGVKAWFYEEQLFNEPFEAFYEILTTNAHPKGFLDSHATPTSTTASTPNSAGRGKGGGGSGKGSTAAAKNKSSRDSSVTAPTPTSTATASLTLPDPVGGPVWERTAMLPNAIQTATEPFSHEAEKLELENLERARQKAQSMIESMTAQLREREQLLAELKKENAEAAGLPPPPAPPSTAARLGKGAAAARNAG